MIDTATILNTPTSLVNRWEKAKDASLEFIEPYHSVALHNCALTNATC
jgi:hypothetical protein